MARVLDEEIVLGGYKIPPKVRDQKDMIKGKLQVVPNSTERYKICEQIYFYTISYHNITNSRVDVYAIANI